MKSILHSLSLFCCLMFSAPLLHAQQRIMVTPAVICAGESGLFQITAPLVPYGKPVAYYTFLFNNGVSLQTTTPLAAYVPAPGYRSVSAQVHFADSSIINIDSTTFPVYYKPIAGFTLTTPDTQCLGATYCFKNLAIRNPLRPSNPILTQVWDYGDAFADSFYANPTTDICHTYYFPGTFGVRQRVIDSLGCRADTFTPANHSPLVLPSARPYFSWKGTPQCFGSTYTFTNDASGYTPTDIKTYTWDFGDSSTYTATAPFSPLQRSNFDSIVHVYTRNGTFSPRLTLSNIYQCTYTYQFTAQNTLTPLPRNTNIDSILIVSQNPNLLTHEKNFCAGNGNKTIYFSHSPIDIAPPGSGIFVWTFGDPASQQLNNNYDSYQPAHVYKSPGTYIVTFDVQNQHPSCSVHFTDTIVIKGPLARIEDMATNVVVAPRQKFQLNGNDTVDFVNNTLAYKNSKLQFVWDFDDEYAPQCTAYSIPNPSFTGPFADALQQYANSTHYYRRGGTTYAGKMNCRWSLDSLPRHRYTNWDSVYQWHLSGKTFPANWDLPAINNFAAITVPAPGIPNPFLLANGVIANIPAGTSITGLSGTLSYFIPGKGTFTYNGSQLLPNSSMTFFEYVFLYSKVHGYHVKLTVKDSASLVAACNSMDSVIISHGKPDARGMSIAGKICPGQFPSGVQFQFAPTPSSSGIKPELGRTILLINFDSLADRRDQTPCNLDGFIGFQGGPTPGGRMYPPFASAPNFSPPSFWKTAGQNSLYYHYGLNAPQNMPPPADSVNGYVTVGVIVGTGCANPPLCDQPLVYSDTIWYHNLIKIERYNPSFTIAQQDGLKSKNTPQVYVPKQTRLSDIKYDAWDWRDNTLTVDSFWYAETPVSDNFYQNGFRRVRYNYTIEPTGVVLKDSLPFPLGLPRTPGKFYTDTLSRSKYCSLSDSGYTAVTKDSAMLLLPVAHKYSRSSFQLSYDQANPDQTLIARVTENNNGCRQAYVIRQTIGIINTFDVNNKQSELDSIFCANEEVNLSSFTRYYRYDNQPTELPFNPGRSFNQVYAPPFDALNYDTINFWQRDAAQTGAVERVRFNSITNRFDTVYYEKLYWDFGDGSPLAKGLNAKHTYTTGGRYTIKMITRDSTGQYDTAYKNIYVSAPKARIAYLRDASKNPITTFNCAMFATVIDSSAISNISSMDAADSIKTNFWWFGENKQDTNHWSAYNNFKPVIAYHSNGLFKVKLVSVSYAGCNDTTSADVFIKGPRPAFKLLTPIEGCAPYTVKILDQSDVFRRFQPPTPNDTPTQSVVYYWGDGTTSVLTHRLDTLVHTYTTQGVFSITAVGSDAKVGGINNCMLVNYPDTNYLQEPPIVTKVAKLSIDTIIGKLKPAPNETVTYQITPTPGATYTWKVNGGVLVSGSGTPTITVEWPTKGIFTLIATKLLYGCSQTETLTVSVFPTGLAKTNTETHFTVYPNPTKGTVNIDFVTSDTREMHIAIYDILGKVCFTDQYTPTSGNNTRSYNIQKLRPGLYFIECTTTTGRTIQKFQVE